MLLTITCCNCVDGVATGFGLNPTAGIKSCWHDTHSITSSTQCSSSNYWQASVNLTSVSKCLNSSNSTWILLAHGNNNCKTTRSSLQFLFTVSSCNYSCLYDTNNTSALHAFMHPYYNSLAASTIVASINDCEYCYCVMTYCHDVITAISYLNFIECWTTMPPAYKIWWRCCSTCSASGHEHHIASEHNGLVHCSICNSYDGNDAHCCTWIVLSSGCNYAFRIHYSSYWLIPDVFLDTGAHLSCIRMHLCILMDCISPQQVH